MPLAEPTVAAIMLTRDRSELARKAVECFRAQTYQNKRLLVWDTGTSDGPPLKKPYEHGVISPPLGHPIGTLRNFANQYAGSGLPGGLDILIHWDDDDWSHPNRIAQQVALLRTSGADVVGYSDMLFWREPRAFGAALVTPLNGETWLYTTTKGGVPSLGTSLCYWRKTWEAHHFADETQGVEDHWLREKKVATVSSTRNASGVNLPALMMIARIHGGNTSNGYRLEEHVAGGSREWKRVPEWDRRVREILG